MVLKRFINNRNFQRLELWLVRASVSRKVFYGLVATAFMSGFITYLSFIKGANSDTILNLIIVNIIILILLVLLIATRLIKLYVNRREGAAGARFHTRLVIVFSFLSITPTLVIYVMSSALFERGVQALVGHVTEDAVSNSVSFSNHLRQSLKGDMEELAKEITHNIRASYPNISSLKTSHSILKQLHEKFQLKDLFILDSQRNMMWSASKGTESNILPADESTWENLSNGFFTIYFAKESNILVAGYPLQLDEPAYVFVAKETDPTFASFLIDTQLLNKKYQDMQHNRWHIRFMFMAIYGFFALLSLLIAIGVGILLADHISKPIGQLVMAAQRIRNGQLDTRVRIQPNIIEFLGLAKAFNLMVGELQAQRQQLETANSDIERRTHFIETTLAGLSSGVIGLDETNHIQVINDAALRIFGINSPIKQHIVDVFPETKDLLYDHSDTPTSDAIVTQRTNKLIVVERNNSLYYLSIHVSLTGSATGIHKVITMDDITELHLAQKKAAWGDVARRVAHEIKNPLTPIQLSAERLKRKYSGTIPETDREGFSLGIETIIRQVSEIERIVKEFSQLSRMPQPVMHEHNVVHVVKNSIQLQRSAYEQIEFQETYSSDIVKILCDEQLLGQAVSNILKNAIESLLDQPHKKGIQLKIHTVLTADDKNVTIKFSDNGKGFPANMIDKFLEPYVTTKKEGTGLGLAITKKIIDDHNGALALRNLEPSGAEVTIVLPLNA